jgi:hypothetical protein
MRIVADHFLDVIAWYEDAVCVQLRGSVGRKAHGISYMFEEIYTISHPASDKLCIYD